VYRDNLDDSAFLILIVALQAGVDTFDRLRNGGF
jgi:hypothetical protein